MALRMSIVSLFLFVFVKQNFALINRNIYDYDAYSGVRLAAGDSMMVLAQNDRGLFSFAFPPYQSSDDVCQAQYPVTGSNTDFQFLYGLAIGEHQTSLQFVYYGHASNDDVPLVGIAEANTMNCFLLFPDVQRLSSYSAQERFVVAVDPLGLFAYGVADIFIFAYDLQTFAIQEYSWYDLFSNSNNPPPVFPSSALPAAIDVSNDGQQTEALVLVYAEDFYFYPTAILLQMQGLNMSFVTLLRLSSSPLPLSIKQYAREYSMAVALNSQHEALIGMTKGSTTMLVSTVGSMLNVIKSQNVPSSGFGKSVMWLDNSSAIGILALSQSTPPWSQSRVYIYDRASWMTNASSMSFTAPLFALPNNHQEIFSDNSWVHIRAGGLPRSSVVILGDGGHVWILPPSRPGQWTIPSNDLSANGYSVFATNGSCSPGSFKNTSNTGPCFLCPVNSTQISMGSSDCIPCNASFFCPPGSTEQIDLSSTVPEYSQSLAYPSPPDNTAFDDILIQRMFAMDSSSAHCLLVSPLFWTMIMGAFVLFILILMGVLKLFPQSKSHRRYLIHFFQQTDLVGEGELWIGGVVSFCVVMQMAFAYWFSIVFLPQYPIEATVHSGFGCDKALRNAKFATTLRAVSIPPADEEQAVFTLLDAQPLTIHVDFVNTQFGCNETTLQQNFEAYYVPLIISNCSMQRSVLSVDFKLAESQFGQYQVNLTGRGSVGGLRLCVRGPSLASDDGKSRVQQLDFCDFFSTDGQTMATSTVVNVQFTRTINETAPLTATDSTLFSAIWTPLTVPRSLSDQLVFAKQGNYLRYLFTQHLLVLELGETAFLIKNSQEPIARQAEVIFHAVLFMMGCLEIFAMFFLVFRLFCWPMLRFVRRRIKRICYPNKVVPIIESESESSGDEHEKRSNDVGKLAIPPATFNTPERLSFPGKPNPFHAGFNRTPDQQRRRPVLAFDWLVFINHDPSSLLCIYDVIV